MNDSTIESGGNLELKEIRLIALMQIGWPDVMIGAADRPKLVEKEPKFVF